MRGMMQQESQAAPAGAPAEAPAEAPTEGMAEDGSEPASPEEQAAYDEVVGNALNIIYDKGEANPAILKALKSDVPGESLAVTTATLVKRLVDSAAQAGKPVDPGVILHAGEAILEELADLMADANIADLSPEEIEGAWYRGVDLFREMQAADGTLDEAGAEADMKAMVEADKAGNLDSVLPGASKAANRFTEGAAKLEAQKGAA